MYILAIETTGTKGSVALIKDSEVQLEKIIDEPMSHLKLLTPQIGEVIGDVEITLENVDAIGVSRGPGSFTGIRIGVATARALGQALEKPIVPIDTLGMFSLVARDRERAVAPIIFARRGQVYGAVYDGKGGEAIKGKCLLLKDLLKEIDDRGLNPIFYCDGVDHYGELLEGREVAAAPERYQRASLVGRMAYEKIVEALSHGKTGETPNDILQRHFGDINQVLPDYLRETEAETKLKDGSLERARAEKLARIRKAASGR